MLTASTQVAIIHDMTDWLSVIEASEQSGYNAEYIRQLLRKNRQLIEAGFVPLFEAVKKAGVWLIEPGSFGKYCQTMKALGSGRHDPTRKPRRR